TTRRAAGAHRRRLVASLGYETGEHHRRTGLRPLRSGRIHLGLEPRLPQGADQVPAKLREREQILTYRQIAVEAGSTTVVQRRKQMDEGAVLVEPGADLGGL